MILFFFGLTQIEASQRYAVAQEQAGAEFVQGCSKVRISQKNLKFDILNETGKSELEFILAYLSRKYDLKNAYNLQHIGMVLLIFMLPGEVYCVLDTLI